MEPAMAEEFDDFLAQALAPPDRNPDRAFVSRVQARIRVEERLEAERRGLLSLVPLHFVGIASIAAGLSWLVQSPAIAESAGQSPAILLMIVLAAFIFVALLFGVTPGARRVGLGSA
jgi:hypothetical protein